MLERSHLRTRTTWTALVLALFLLPGLASAQIDKVDQKCINSINKGAAKVAKAQAGDNNACAKDYGKEKIGSAASCVTSDPKGKVSKAISKIKTSDCSGAPAALPNLDTDSASIGATMVSKDLDLLADLFSSDLDAVLVLASVNKDGSKCQGAVLKAAGKCQDAKLSSFNSCKKDGMKAGFVSSAATLSDECLGTGTGTIPDGKGKIAKKCGGDFDIGKKCSGQNLEALFPGLPSPVNAAAVDAAIECRVCLAIDGIDGLGRNCDEFDDGEINLSCPVAGTVLGTHRASQDGFAQCEGGDNDGAQCFSALPPNICTDGGGTCVPKASFLITSNQDNVVELPSLTESMTEITCGPVNPDGTAECTNVNLGIAGQSIFPIGFLCFRPRPDLNCPTGLIDCDGGTPQDQDAIMKHDVASFANTEDPVSFPFTDCRVNPADAGDLSCFGAGGPSCIANQTCSDMCDLYCASLGPEYEQESSGCEGICQGEDPNSIKFGAVCVSHGDCAEGLELTIDDVSCAGGSLNSPHAGQCQCECLAQGIGAPGRPGALRIETGLQGWIESAGPCDQTDVTIVLEPDCVEYTTELSTATVLDDGAEIGVNWTDVPLLGDPGGGCAPLSTGNTSGSRLVSHSGNFDSGIGDVISRSVLVAK